MQDNIYLYEQFFYLTESTEFDFSKNKPDKICFTVIFLVSSFFFLNKVTRPYQIMNI